MSPVSRRILMLCLTGLSASASLALPASGCGGGSADGDDLEPDAELLPADCLGSQVICERQVACGVAIVNQADTVSACMTALGCAAADELPAGIVFDDANVAACEAAVEAATCEELAAIGLKVDDACAGRIRGTLEAGAACDSALFDQCAGDLVCAGETCPGACATPPPACIEGGCGEGEFCDEICTPVAGLGEECEFSEMERSCGAALGCRYIDDGRVCVDVPGEGEACNSGDLAFDQCDEGLTCLDDVCATPRALDEACATAFECASSFCDFADNTCQPRLEQGATCHLVFGECGPGLVCNVASEGADEGVCGAPVEPAPVIQPIAALGESCLEKRCELGSICLCDDAGCETATCGGLIEPGESCFDAVLGGGSSLVCAEGVCDLFASQECVVPKAPGEACDGSGLSFECASTVCDDGVCAPFDVACGGQ